MAFKKFNIYIERMKLKDIFELKPGVLIKGLRTSPFGVIELCINGWDVYPGNNENARQHSFSFKFYENERVSNLIKNGKIENYSPNNVKYSILRKNGESFYKDVGLWFNKEKLHEGQAIGMSLGRSFVAIQPYQADIYRPDFYEIYIFHQILHGGKIKWIVLQSKTQQRGLLVMEPDKVLLSICANLL